MLQNSEVSAVVRSPGDSLTVLGAPGGTLVDFAPVGTWDRLWEAVPMVDGGWNPAAELEVGDDYVQVGAVRWTLPPDVPWIEVSGADALWLHGDRRSLALDTDFVRSELLYGTDGSSAVDLGGAQVVEGVTRIVVGPWDSVRRELYTTPVSGTCAGSQVDVLDVEGSRIALLSPDFDTVVPDAATTLICRASGYADGDPVAIGEDLELPLGGFGELLIRVADERGVELPVVVEVDGVGTALPRRDEIPTGEGSFEVRVHHGPGYTEFLETVAVAGSVELEIVLERQVPEDAVLVDLFRAPFPSRLSRVEQNDDLELASAGGIGFVVQAPPDEIGRPYQSDWTERTTRVQAGSLALTEDVGRVWSWPWSGNDKRPGHGAVRWAGLDASDVLAAADGYDVPNRVLVVDAAWVAAAGNSALWPEDPDLLFLEDLDDLETYFGLLDQGLRIGVAGPLTWVSADPDAGLPSVAAMERGLVTHQSLATTGPHLEWRVVEVGLPSEPHRVFVSADGEIWADGALVASGAGWHEVSAERWVVVVLRGEDWAVSGPHWLDDGPPDRLNPQ